MSHRIGRRFLTGSVRARAIALLVFWAASLLAPVFHAEELRDDDSASIASSTRHEPCTGRFAARDVGCRVAPSCDPNVPCRDPLHHHHPLGHHDATQCPICSSLVERPAEIPVFTFAPQLAVRCTTNDVVTVPSSAERFACALARGPPLPPV